MTFSSLIFFLIAVNHIFPFFAKIVTNMITFYYILGYWIKGSMAKDVKTEKYLKGALVDPIKYERPRFHLSLSEKNHCISFKLNG